jgi:succinate dehydrogenase / fumarate reductase iron-sulfur subunit
VLRYVEDDPSLAQRAISTSTDPNVLGGLLILITTLTAAQAFSPAPVLRRPVLAGEAGPWRCHFAGECSRVCPKGVDPARAIQLMKRELVLDYLRLRRERCPASVAATPAGITRREGIPDAPKPTL